MLNVQGQPRAVGQLQRSLASGRLASTWIFAGPEGVGKFMLAVELARTVLCDRPVRRKNGEGGASVKTLPAEFELKLACGECESCRAIGVTGKNGNHPDLHVVTKELIRYHDAAGKSKGTNISVHVIRGEITGDPAENKEAKIAKRAFRGKGKFFIIDEADLMDAMGQNILLKTLEEPPADTYLVLITTSPQELLSTIRSRSQLVEFGELPTAVIAKQLMEATIDSQGGEVAGLLKDDAELMARVARGSLGRALRWAQDIRVIDRKNAEAAERAEKKAARTEAAGGGGDEEEVTDKFSPGGILTWTRELGGMLDQLVAGRANASEAAGLIAKYAGEYAAMQLQRDKLASVDRAKRDGIRLLLAIIAEWFADRMRQGIGADCAGGSRLPGVTEALDREVAPELIAAARSAEFDIDWNANEKILLAATTTRWEQLLKR